MSELTDDLARVRELMEKATQDWIEAELRRRDGGDGG